MQNEIKKTKKQVSYLLNNKKKENKNKISFGLNFIVIYYIFD